MVNIHDKIQLGDSRAVLLTTSDEVIALSEDHKPDRFDERQRIEALGGHVVMKGVYVMFVGHTDRKFYLKKTFRIKTQNMCHMCTQSPILRL